MTCLLPELAILNRADGTQVQRHLMGLELLLLKYLEEVQVPSEAQGVNNKNWCSAVLAS